MKDRVWRPANDDEDCSPAVCALRVRVAGPDARAAEHPRTKMRLWHRASRRGARRPKNRPRRARAKAMARRAGSGRGRVAASWLRSPATHARPLARSNADRRRSLHPAKPLPNIAPPPNRRVAPKPATASGNVPARGQAPRRPRRNQCRPGPPKIKLTVRGSAIGGPHAAAGPRQLGGPATGRTAHNTAIGGTQLRRKMQI